MIIPNYFYTFAENMAMQPKVSIIITVYNRKKFIEECARSLFEQSLDDIEYIFVNDASTDNSIEVLEKTASDYPKRIPFIKIITLDKNGGVANAFYVSSTVTVSSSVTNNFGIMRWSEPTTDTEILTGGNSSTYSKFTLLMDPNTGWTVVWGIDTSTGKAKMQ